MIESVDLVSFRFSGRSNLLALVPLVCRLAFVIDLVVSWVCIVKSLKAAVLE